MKKLILILSALLVTASAFAQGEDTTPKYSYKQTGFASVPKVGGYIIGGPDLVVEVISPSTRKRDMTVKVFKYMGCGVREYWIVNPESQTARTYYFNAGSEAATREYDFDDSVPVKICDGFRIRVSDLL